MKRWGKRREETWSEAGRWAARGRTRGRRHICLASGNIKENIRGEEGGSQLLRKIRIKMVDKCMKVNVNNRSHCINPSVGFLKTVWLIQTARGVFPWQHQAQNNRDHRYSDPEPDLSCWNIHKVSSQKDCRGTDITVQDGTVNATQQKLRGAKVKVKQTSTKLTEQRIKNKCI